MWTLEEWYWWNSLQGGRPDREQTCGCYSGRRVGWADRVAWKHVTICKGDSRKFLCSSGSSALLSSDDLEGWHGKVGGRGYMYTCDRWMNVWQKPTQHCKANTLQLKVEFWALELSYHSSYCNHSVHAGQISGWLHCINCQVLRLLDSDHPVVILGFSFCQINRVDH